MSVAYPHPDNCTSQKYLQVCQLAAPVENHCLKWEEVLFASHWPRALAARLSKKAGGSEEKEFCWFQVSLPPALFSLPADTLGVERINPRSLT